MLVVLQTLMQIFILAVEFLIEGKTTLEDRREQKGESQTERKSSL